MIHFIRTKNNNTIIDVESTKDDLQVVICIKEYSKYLLSLPSDKQASFISHVDSISEMRGTYFESNINNYSSSKMAEIILKEFAKQWGLYYVED